MIFFNGEPVRRIKWYEIGSANLALTQLCVMRCNLGGFSAFVAFIYWQRFMRFPFRCCLPVFCCFVMKGMCSLLGFTLPLGCDSLCEFVFCSFILFFRGDWTFSAVRRVNFCLGPSNPHAALESLPFILPAETCVMSSGSVCWIPLTRYNLPSMQLMGTHG